MKRTILPLEVSTMKVRRRSNKPLEDFECDFVKVCEYVVNLDKQKRKKDFEKVKKIVYLDKSEYDKSNGTLFLCLKSARYARQRTVINTETLRSRGILKNKKDGDEERTHLVFKFDIDDTAVCLVEKNMDGVGIGQVFEYLDDFIIKYHEVQKDEICYSLIHANIVSGDFLEALGSVKKIKGVTLTIAQKDLSVSELKDFSGNGDLSDDIDLIYKPAARGKSITSNTVKDFFKLYNKKGRKVKRITVKADDKAESAIVFDTEKIKEKEVVEIEETVTGEVREESIKNKLMEIVEKY